MAYLRSRVRDTCGGVGGVLMPPRKRRRTTESCRPLGLGTLVIAFDGFRVRQTGERELRVEKDDERWSLASQGLA